MHVRPAKALFEVIIHKVYWAFGGRKVILAENKVTFHVIRVYESLKPAQVCKRYNYKNEGKKPVGLIWEERK